MNKIYVGNISYDVTEDQIRQLFTKHGTVTDVALAIDKATQKPRGFAFVFMADDGEARAAIGALNGHRMEGRPLRVKQARAKGEKEPPKPATGLGPGPRGRRRRPIGRGYSSAPPSRGYRGRGDQSGGGSSGNR